MEQYSSPKTINNSMIHDNAWKSVLHIKYKPYMAKCATHVIHHYT